jgi:hypothetical protein
MTTALRRATGLVLAGLFAIACGGSPTVSGVPTIAPIDVPSIAIPSGSFQIPSFAPDPAVEAGFPAQIDGQPLTDMESANFLAVLQSFSFDPELINRFVAAMQGLGINPATVGFGSATATVDDEPVSVQAVRFPGANAGAALDALVRIDEPDDPPTLTTQTIGGKTVTVATDSDGDVEYYWVNGEWAWFLASATPEQAEVIFAGLS